MYTVNWTHVQSGVSKGLDMLHSMAGVEDYDPQLFFEYLEAQCNSEDEFRYAVAVVVAISDVIIESGEDDE
jgi:hypothetical protein